MKKLTISLLIIFLFITTRSMANLEAINIGAINGWESLENEINYLWANQGMYRFYQLTWSFPETRESVIKKLEDLLNKLNKLESKNKKNIDYYLLKGDIAHYLYNLDATGYYQAALDYYETARKIDKRDYRPAWFIGQHQCLSQHDIAGIESYREIVNDAEPSSLHWAFWGDYSTCSVIAMMHFNSMMAFEHMFRNKGEFKNIEEEPYFDAYNKIKKLVLDPDPEKKYDASVFWKKVSKEEIYLSVPLGIRIHSSNDWQARFTPFDNRICAAMFNTDKTKDNADNALLISVIVYIPEKDEDMKQFIQKCTANFPDVKKIVLKNNYKTEEVYESRDSSSIKEDGVKRTTFLFIEREEPEYPGVAVEYPLLNESGNGVYAYEKFYSRFKGKIYYCVVMRSAEKDHQQQLKKYTDLINNKLILD